METKAMLLGAGLIGTIIIGMFAYSYVARHYEPTEVVVPAVSAPATTSAPTLERIDAKHFFADGVHTVVGSLTYPTPCEVPTVEVQIAESYPEQVTILITTLTTATNCAPTTTEQRFMATFTASAAATISAQFNGQPVLLNLIPAAVGETPETLESITKG